jgi:hypothetical protein
VRTGVKLQADDSRNDAALARDIDTRRHAATLSISLLLLISLLLCGVCGPALRNPVRVCFILLGVFFFASFSFWVACRLVFGMFWLYFHVSSMVSVCCGKERFRLKLRFIHTCSYSIIHRQLVSPTFAKHTPVLYNHK